MKLMSWGGEVAVDVAVPELMAEQKRSSMTALREGVSHGDERAPDLMVFRSTIKMCITEIGLI